MVALPAMGSRRVTVAQLQQILTAQRAGHKSDASMADTISSLELTEELTEPSLERLTKDLRPGPKSAQALLLLADSSAVLAPPAEEIPSTFKPDIAMEHAILAGAVNFVLKTMAHMPDFLATRTTHSFDDRPLVVGHSGYAPVTNLHAVGTFNRTITYRGGREVADSPLVTASEKPHVVAGPEGLNTSGEFGPVLAIVLSDAAKGTIAWDRWEMTSEGKAAVFHYVVPEAVSHYQVDYCCGWGDTGAGSYHGKPGYHGDLFVDPFTGAIVRITLEAEMGKAQVITYAAIAVNYGKVDIGGSTYICPVRSVAISAALDREGKVIGGAAPVRRINEVSFTNYHRFGSTSRIVADAQDQPAAAPGASELSVQAPSAAPAPAEPATEASEANAASTQIKSEAPGPDQQTAAPRETVAEADAAPPAGDASTPVFKTTAREVVVDVVVTKGNGDAVLGLDKGAFALKEDGKAQTIDFFEEHTAAAAPKSAPPAMPPMPAEARTNVPPAPESDSVNVLLIDMLNTSLRDQVFVHNAIDDFLKNLKPGTRVAIFTLGAKLRFVQGFTADASLLQAALQEKKNGVTPQKDAASRDRGDDAEDAADLSRLRMVHASPFGIAALEAAQSELSDVAQARRMAITFEALNALSGYLQGVPGRKNLIWIAGSFPVIIFPSTTQRESMLQQPQSRGYLDHVKETADMLTAAKIAVYPVSAEGMMEEHVLEADSAGPGSAEGVTRTSNQPGIGSPMSPYMTGATDRADTIASMERLASQTGGKAYYNTNDLNGAAQKAINDGANYYTLAYSPTNQRMDGAYREIDLHLTEGHYKIAYRRGYNADKTPQAASATGGDPLWPLLTLGLPSATGILYGGMARPTPEQPAPGEPPAGQNHELKGTLTRYAVDLILRLEDVDLEPNAKGGRTGKILVGVKAYDRDGGALNWQGGVENLEMSAREYAEVQRTGIRARLEIDLPSLTGIHVVTGVYDWTSGKTGTLEIALPAATATTAAPSPATH